MPEANCFAVCTKFIANQSKFMCLQVLVPQPVCFYLQTCNCGYYGVHTSVNIMSLFDELVIMF